MNESYEVIKEQQVYDCNARGILLKHKKSGARVCILSNDDDNKVFTIGFRTPPSDSTGVAHILEHSVLCGSEKYPAKDPFKELEKGSMNTYLNAYTCPDKTIYPVASCNDRDFANLMAVYMDAVFYPNIYRRKEIFMQEGWHYQIKDKNEPITINGVVYNEMKGALSTPESRITRKAIHTIFPDNAYRYESGGSPAEIPKLSYEKFLEFHKKYYHPSNSYIYLYGNVDIDERLEWMDREYLSKFDREDIDSTVKNQKPIGTLDVTDSYPLGNDESDENATYLTWAAMAGDGADIEKMISVEVVLEVLFEISGAPVKEALVSAGVGQDISFSLYDDLQQAFVMVMAMNTEAEKMPEFKKILREELEKAAREGLNKQSLRAILNRAEFGEAEADFGNTPKGLVYIENSMDTWIYDENDPFSTLNKRKIFAELKEKIDTDYFEKVLSEVLLNSCSNVYITSVPSKTVSDEEDALLAQKLDGYKRSLSEEELDNLIKENLHLEQYQSEPSTKEELETIPMLTREDIGMQVRPIVNEKDSFGDIPVVFHDVETNNIVYLKLFFDLGGVPEDKLCLMPLLTKCIGSMDTKKRSYFDLDNEINVHTGGVGMDTLTFNRRGGSKYYRPMLFIDVRMMRDETDNVLPLIKEMLCETVFESKKRLKDLLGEERTGLKYHMNRSAHSVAILEARSHINPEYEFIKRVTGITEYKYIEKALKFSSKEYDELISELYGCVKHIIGCDNMMVDVTCSRSTYDSIRERLAGFANEIPTTDVEWKAPADHCGIMFETVPAGKAYRNSGAVNYVAMSGNFDEYPEETVGKFDVASQIVSNEYLYNNIRLKGGAYGCGFNTVINGNISFFYSYRDPHVAETLEIYRKTPDFLRNYDADEREMLKNIIGFIGLLDTPLSPYSKGMRSLRMLMAGTTEEMLLQFRKGVISTTVENIRSMADIVEKILEKSDFCAVGSGKCIEENKDLFNSTESLM